MMQLGCDGGTRDARVMLIWIYLILGLSQYLLALAFFTSVLMITVLKIVIDDNPLCP